MLQALEAVGRDDIGAVGGKAANLGELLRAGIPLPNGFCVPAAVYARFLEVPAVRAALDALVAASPAEVDRELDAFSARIREAFRAEPLPEDVRVAISAAYRALAGEDGPVAVRSSATAEDLPEASFAGQQETYLNVRGAEAVCQAVRECWGSLWTPRAISYRARQGFRHEEVRLAVVVQRMVRPDVSGVLFTLDPMSARRTHMLVNASWGLGEAIVSGRVTPDAYTLARAGNEVLSKRALGTKAVRIDARPEGGTTETAVVEADRARFCLEVDALAQLRDVALRVEAHFGCPQDLEWAFEGGTLYVLQARPITSLAPELPDFSRLNRMERFVLDDILEHFPESPLPLDYDAVVDTYEQIQQMTREAGMDAAAASSIITLDPEDGVCRVVPSSPRATWRTVQLPWLLLAKLWTKPGRWEREHARSVDARLESLAGRAPPARADGALADMLREASRLASQVGALRFSTVVAPLLLLRGVLQGLARLARRKVDDFEWLAGLSHHTTQTEVALQRLADHALARPDLREALLAPGGPDAALDRLAPQDSEWAQLVGDFLQRFGARTMRLYLPFSARAWSEDPAALTATLQSLVRAGRPGAAQARMAAGTAKLEALRAEVSRALPWFARGILHGTVERFRAFHVEREATVYAIERAFVQARRAAAEIARRLVARGALRSEDERLLLTQAELLALFRGELEVATARRRIARRRERRSAAVACWQGHRIPRDDARNEGALRGEPGSPGRAQGPVRVIRAPEEFHRLMPGDVLVCPFTDPAWTPLFALASAVVADTGGPLSHAAIVAREYGIPAVLGVQTGTLRLTDGEIVVVDGSRGIVEPQSSSPREGPLKAVEPVQPHSS